MHLPEAFANARSRWRESAGILLLATCGLLASGVQAAHSTAAEGRRQAEYADAGGYVIVWTAGDGADLSGANCVALGEDNGVPSVALQSAGHRAARAAPRLVYELSRFQGDISTLGGAARKGTEQDLVVVGSEVPREIGEIFRAGVVSSSGMSIDADSAEIVDTSRSGVHARRFYLHATVSVANECWVDAHPTHLSILGRAGPAILGDDVAGSMLGDRLGADPRREARTAERQLLAVGLGLVPGLVFVARALADRRENALYKFSNWSTVDVLLLRLIPDALLLGLSLSLAWGIVLTNDSSLAARAGVHSASASAIVAAVVAVAARVLTVRRSPYEFLKE